jgi:hypothetical protein
MLRFGLFSIVALFAQGLQTMKDCSSSNTLGHIQSLTMDPSAPVAGQFVIVTLDYVLDKAVTAGTAKYEASFNGFPLTPTIDDLCTDLADSTTPCPLFAGPIQYMTSLQMGDETTHGTLDAKVTWTNQDSEQILCWEFVVRI